MKYAVVKINGSQFKVSEGIQLEVTKLSEKEGETVNFNEILFLSDGKTLTVGKPLVSGASVKAKILNNFQGEKIHIHKFKAKTGYRRKMGFRPQKTLIQIEKITA